MLGRSTNDTLIHLGRLIVRFHACTSRVLGGRGGRRGLVFVGVGLKEQLNVLLLLLCSIVVRLDGLVLVVFIRNVVFRVGRLMIGIGWRLVQPHGQVFGIDIPGGLFEGNGTQQGPLRIVHEDIVIHGFFHTKDGLQFDSSTVLGQLAFQM